MCNNCKRKKRDAMEEVWVVELAIQDLLLSNQATRGLPPEAEADAEADDDNVTFQVDHDLFTAKEAVVAAIEVATALAFNNEIGFEKLINTEHEPDDVSKKRCKHRSEGVYEEAILRLAYIADPTVIPHRMTKAASALGGVSALRGLIPGKDGMPNVGHVDEAAQRRFIDRIWKETLQKKQYCRFSNRERDQCREFLKCDDKACLAATISGVTAYVRTPTSGWPRDVLGQGNSKGAYVGARVDDHTAGAQQLPEQAQLSRRPLPQCVQRA